ncbi:MAG TPA: hypothetical protein VM754_12270 [Actinomycetota bacterium]|nr:hypothetical protein [Actinomycetota bacterium]
MDHPERDDENWLKHSLVARAPAAARVTSARSSRKPSSSASIRSWL